MIAKAGEGAIFPLEIGGDAPDRSPTPPIICGVHVIALDDSLFGGERSLVEGKP